MKLGELYSQAKKPIISLEVSPPKTDTGSDNLINELKNMLQWDPAYISVTYGAGGTNQDKSLGFIERTIREINKPVMPHLTCIGSKPETIESFLHTVESWGVKNIMALRGDHPKNIEGYAPASNYFQYANDLVSFIRARSSVDMAVAGYPEVHPEARSLTEDLEHLRRKVDAGSSTVITQLFFNNEDFLRFRDKAVKMGINAHFIPGILPITSFAQIQKVTGLGGSKIPEDFMHRLFNAGNDDAAVKAIGIDHCIKQYQELVRAGVPGIHLYTFNKSEGINLVLEGANA